MSNTSVVTPYAPPSPPPPDVAESVKKGLAAMLNWLTEISDEERNALDKLKESKRKERLTLTDVRCLDKPRSSCQPLASSVSLHLKDVSSLMEAATKQGYQKVHATKEGLMSEKRIILLQDASKHRIAIQQQSNGQLTLHASGDANRLKSLVRQHTRDRTLAHLKARGMEIETSLNNRGEVELVATESRALHGDGKAEVRARITDEGQINLDVSRVQGRRCQEITESLAEAVHGEISQDEKKEFYWRLPGSLNRAKQRV
jgi:hypothetical protein